MAVSLGASVGNETEQRAGSLTNASRAEHAFNRFSNISWYSVVCTHKRRTQMRRTTPARRSPSSPARFKSPSVHLNAGRACPHGPQTGSPRARGTAGAAPWRQAGHGRARRGRMATRRQRRWGLRAWAAPLQRARPAVRRAKRAGAPGRPPTDRPLAATRLRAHGRRRRCGG